MADETVMSADQNEKLDALRELPITADNPRFDAEEMIVCSICSRGNPPTRLACLYCGAGLDVSRIHTDLAQVNFQRPENWEDGFSVIYIGQGRITDESAGRAADVLGMETGELINLAAVGTPVPIAYIKSLPDAELLASRLTDLSLECAITGDDLLTPQAPPTRVRSIEFYDDGVILEDFNTANKIAIGSSERVLFVTGAIFKIRSETTGKRKKKTVKITETAETLSDETVLDIYPPSDVLGFRIRSNGFNFSCLGERMRRIASENMVELIDRLNEAFPNRVSIDAYRSAYPALDTVWPVESKNQSSEVRRGTFGGVKIEKITVSDNTEQFTRYSRLQRHFI